MISAKRYFELYGQGDIKTQMFLKTLQQTLGDDHFETYEVQNDSALRPVPCSET